MKLKPTSFPLAFTDENGNENICREVIEESKEADALDNGFRKGRIFSNITAA